MKKIGKLKAKSSKEISGSKIGLGLECLDRQMWDDTDEVYKLAGELGIKYARLQTGWCRCETVKGKYDFAWLDRSVDKLLEEGIQPWFCLSYGNILYSEAKTFDAIPFPPIYSEEAKTAWLNFTAALVKHFKGRVIHYEVWNEPDIDSFWGNADPKEYMKLLKMTAPVIRENDSTVKIIGASLARGVNWDGFAVLEKYLEEGYVDLVDVHSFHRYHYLPEMNRATDYISLKETFKAYGGEHIELWQGESGCPSQMNTGFALAGAPYNEDAQAKSLARNILVDLTADMDHTSYFHLSDFTCYHRNGVHEFPSWYGVISFDNPPKLRKSYFMMQNICSIFDEDTTLNSRIIIKMDFDGMDDSEERYSFQTKIINTRFSTFERKGKPLLAWWFPADLLPLNEKDEFKERDVNLYIWTHKEDIKDPVVIDPMTGDIFTVESSHEGGPEWAGDIDIKPVLKLSKVPLKDYPMIVADRETIADMIRLI